MHKWLESQNVYNSNSIKKDLKMFEGEDSKDKTNGRWTKEEHQKFMLGLQLYGKNWKKIEALIVTRNGSQIRSHAQKYFLKATGKNSYFEDSVENHEPLLPSQGTRKKTKQIVEIPDLGSPFFWSQLYSLAFSPNFDFWTLIDQPQRSTTPSNRQKSFIHCEQQNKMNALRPTSKANTIFSNSTRPAQN